MVDSVEVFPAVLTLWEPDGPICGREMSTCAHININMYTFGYSADITSFFHFRSSTMLCFHFKYMKRSLSRMTP